MKILSRVVTSFLTLSCVSMALTAGAVQAQAQAADQQAPPPRTRVATVQVKPEMLRAWLDLQRTEVLPALKKAGMPWRWVFSNGGPVGPGFTFTIVQPVARYAQFDEGPAVRRGMTPEAYTRYLDKERTMIVSTDAYVQTLVPTASLVSGSSTAPALAVITTLQLLPGKGPDFAKMTAAEYLPAMKKAGVSDYWVLATNFGGPQGQRTIVQPLAKWADLDAPNPLARALGPEAALQLVQKRSQLQAGPPTVTVVSFVPDLSFGAPPPPTR